MGKSLEGRLCDTRLGGHSLSAGLKEQTRGGPDAVTFHPVSCCLPNIIHHIRIPPVICLFFFFK